MPAPDPEAVAEAAERRFAEGYNCCQSVLWAVAEGMGRTCPRCIPAVGLAMGGGVGHTGRVCGALTGAVMALGLAVDAALAGRPIDRRKAEANRLAGGLVGRFVEVFGSADCADLLGFRWDAPRALQRYRQKGAKAAVCTPCVRWAAWEAARLVAGLRAR